MGVGEVDAGGSVSGLSVESRELVQALRPKIAMANEVVPICWRNIRRVGHGVVLIVSVLKENQSVPRRGERWVTSSSR